MAGLPLRPLFLVVACKVLFGVNLYDILSLRWLFVNLLIGAALVPLVLGIAKHFSGRIDRPPFLQRIMDDLAGSNLNAATASLAALAKFSEEAE